MKSSWKTSLGGIGMIAGGIASGCHALQQKPIDGNSLAAAPTPGLWPLVDEYYKQKHIEGWIVEHPSQIPVTKL